MAGVLDEAARARAQRAGVVPLRDEDGLALLDAGRASAAPMLVAISLDAAALRAQADAGALHPILRGLELAPARSAPAAQGALVRRLASAPEGEWEAIAVEVVREHVASVLGHSSAQAIDARRPFRDLGFDSLSAVELRNRLIQATGLRIAPTVLFEIPTPQELASYLAERVREEGPALDVAAGERDSSAGTLSGLLRDAHQQGSLAEFVPVVTAASRFRPAFHSRADLDRLPPLATLAQGEGTQLICVPSFVAGSGPHQFSRLANALDGRRRVSAFSLPGFGGASHVPESWGAAIDALAASVREHVGDDRFVLVGYSIGGAAAYALARQLEDDGVQPAGLVMIDTYAPESQAEMHHVFGDVMATILNRGHALIQESVDDDGLLAMGAYFRVGEEWEPLPIEAPALLVRASEPLGDAFEAGRLRWWQLPPDVVEVEGDHFGVVDDAAGPTAEAIDAWIRGTIGEPEPAAVVEAIDSR